MRKRRPARTALILLSSSFLIAPVLGETAVLLPSKDNTLYESATGSLSNGSGMNLFAGKTRNGEIRRALLEFDVAGQIPPRSTIASASLVLMMSRTRSGPTTVSLHRVLSEWGEGASDAGGAEGTGGPAAEGDATWLHTIFDTLLWSNPGGDFDSTPSASQTVDGFGSYVWGPTADMSVDVQSWLDDPGGNHGWLVMGNESDILTAKRFASRENPTTDWAPRLIVEFVPPFRFDRLDAEAMSMTFETPGSDSFVVTASYALSAESDGIDPESEEVVVELGSYAASLPPGSFGCLGDVCRFDGEGPGLAEVVITPGMIAIAADGIDLSGTSNPARVLIAIGNDEASAEARVAGTLRTRPQRPSPRRHLLPQKKHHR